jgi:hypothetical protein
MFFKDFHFLFFLILDFIQIFSLRFLINYLLWALTVLIFRIILEWRNKWILVITWPSPNIKEMNRHKRVISIITLRFLVIKEKTVKVFILWRRVEN